MEQIIIPMDFEIELFCPSCEIESLFAKNRHFSDLNNCPVYQCINCGFPIFISTDGEIPKETQC